MKYINILLLILSLLVNNCYSILKLYDGFNNELVSFYNVDLPKVNNNASYVEVIGNLFIATFNKNDDDPCKISGMPDNVDVLVIPFLQALKLGCKSYANILTSNSWVMIMSSQNLTNLKNVNEHNLNMYKSVTNNPKLIPRTLIIESLKGTLSPSSTNSKFHNPKEFNLETNIQTNVKEQVSNFSKGFTRILKEFGAKIKNHIQKVSKRIEDKVKEFINQKRELKSFAPKVIIFSSSHNGTPGIREQYNGDFNILGTAIPHLTLLSIEDTEKLIKIANKVIYVEITSEQGPWISLLKSESWKVFSIIMGVLYILIVMITMFLIPRTYMNLGCSLFNPIFWVYPGLSIISFHS
ncbi:hypothetical protein C1645_152113 [Glomus cerebriforme]|uniref:Uncharacterized protein n=1 Tax=Glomus cerebriforme TaxID=658196 RepID=A0A397SZS2_9GLOM|nr:hypothetical protein C1645_152113 [Glomus cerebriforme]